VVNGDDPAAGDFMAAAPGRCIVYGLGAGCEVRAEEVVHTRRGTRFDLVHPGGRLPVCLRLAGLFNVYNALAAAAAGIGLGVDQEVIRRGLESVTGVPGRFETVDAGQDFTVIVDYAHTPDGLANVLRAARGMGGGKLITVFGCGGDRDRGKRPLMGAIAAAHSDLCVVTSDNPRSEEPEAIIADIVAGIAPGTGGEVKVESDRRRAIQLALEAARAGDVVVIAGKGHETYQLVKGQSFPFDDRAVARELLGGEQHA
jgi:UDP-N-acetylmuramoyl-L-alanyl-D-glutamate--2,6-diaminopimelate ligase